jgi:hypothetical protein
VLSRLTDIILIAGWLTAERILAYARIFVAVLVVATFGWVGLSHGLLDPAGHPLGTDFLNVYAAGVLTDKGQAAAAYDWPTHHAMEQSIVAYDGYYGWHYPPMFLFLAAPLALVPYAASLVVYLALTFVAYLAVLTRLVGPVPGRSWLVAGFPAVFVNLGHGQNGFLTTALLAGGCACLTTRPLLAGLLLGCLAYKPQVAVLLPIALLLGGYWRTVLVAGATALALALASLVVFGQATWIAFFASLEPTRTIVLEQGATGWEKIVSVFSAVRMFGRGIEFAYALQTLVTLAVMGVVGWVWWRSRRICVSIGCLALAIPLTTPYVLDYDLMVLAVAVFALAREGIETGFRPGEKSMLALVTLAPLLARGIGSALHMPIVPPILILALMLFARRAVPGPLENARGVAIIAE